MGQICRVPIAAAVDADINSKIEIYHPSAANRDVGLGHADTGISSKIEIYYPAIQIGREFYIVPLTLSGLPNSVVKFYDTISQDKECLEKLKYFQEENFLPIEFLGFQRLKVPLEVERTRQARFSLILDKETFINAFFPIFKIAESSTEFVATIHVKEYVIDSLLVTYSSEIPDRLMVSLQTSKARKLWDFNPSRWIALYIRLCIISKDESQEDFNYSSKIIWLYKQSRFVRARIYEFPVIFKWRR